MKREQTLEQLLALLEKLDITVKYNRGNFRSGLVRYRGKRYFYLNRKADADKKIGAIIQELKLLRIQENFIPEEIKLLLKEDSSSKTEQIK